MRTFVPLSRLGAWIALGCHVIVASGLPLPLGVRPGPTDPASASRIAGKDRSRPFPCMDKPCGCATADQCFANCCCHTPAQRLAWARARRVEPAVVAALERRVMADTAAPAACCAALRADTSCCSAAADTSADTEAREVCRDYRSLAADAEHRSPPDDPDDVDPPAPRLVILRDMLACGGILTVWLACGTALPPPLRVAPPAHDAPAGTVALDDVVAASVSAAPAVPPPRVG